MEEEREEYIKIVGGGRKKRKERKRRGRKGEGRKRREGKVDKKDSIGKNGDIKGRKEQEKWRIWVEKKRYRRKLDKRKIVN